MIRFYRTAVDTEMSADYTEAELPPILAPLARGELTHASLSAEQQDALDGFLVEIDWKWVDTRDETIEVEWEED